MMLPGEPNALRMLLPNEDLQAYLKIRRGVDLLRRVSGRSSRPQSRNRIPEQRNMLELLSSALIFSTWSREAADSG